MALASLTMLFVQVPSASARDKCSQATLNGSYGVIASGTAIGVGSVALIGVFNFDGAGIVSGTVTQKVNGNNVQVTFSGTYAVDENCLASDNTLVSNGQTAIHAYVIVNNGLEFYILNTTPRMSGGS